MFAIILWLTVISYVHSANDEIFKADHPTVSLITTPEYDSWKPGTEVTFKCLVDNRRDRNIRLSLWKTKTIHNRDILLTRSTNELTSVQSVWLQNLGCWLYCLGDYEENNATYYARSENVRFSPENHNPYLYYDSNEEGEVKARRASGRRVTVRSPDRRTHKAGAIATYSCAAGPESVGDSDSVYTLSWVQKKVCRGVPHCRFEDLAVVLNSETFNKTSSLFDNELHLSKKMDITDQNTRLFCAIQWNEYSDTIRAKSDDINLIVL